LPIGRVMNQAQFLEYVQSGGQAEATDWLPDEYRAKLVKFIEMHGNSELMGVLPEREWILRAPTLQRKLALTAKVQDEVGHSQLIYRVVEDLGKPREQCLEDLISGKSKFHNVFHYPTKTWGDVGVIAWLVDAAAIISQKALLKCSYAPYARIMKKICWEESFHILHGRDVVLTMMNGTDEQRELVQEALTRWWGPLMQFHGNPIAREEDPMFVWRIKSQGNEEARQRFLDGYVPQRGGGARWRAGSSHGTRCTRSTGSWTSWSGITIAWAGSRSRRSGRRLVNARARLLLAIADDELVLGWRDSEWTGIAPSLEEDVAFSSISQNEIGHARALYELAARELGTTADELAFDRQPEEYLSAPLVELRKLEWARTIAR